MSHLWCTPVVVSKKYHIASLVIEDAIFLLLVLRNLIDFINYCLMILFLIFIVDEPITNFLNVQKSFYAIHYFLGC